MTLQQLLETALPVVAALIIALIQQDTLPNLVNALIAIVVLVLSAFTTVWLGNGLTGRPDADIAVVLTATLALQSVPYFQPYFDYIRNNLLLIAPRAPAQVEASTPLPTPIIAPPTPITASPKSGKKSDPSTPAS